MTGQSSSVSGSSIDKRRPHTYRLHDDPSDGVDYVPV